MNISAIGSNAYKYVKRGLAIAPDFVLGTGNETFSKALTDSFYGKLNKEGKREGGKYFKNFWTQLKEATLETEKINNANIENNKGFFKNMFHQIQTLPELMQSGWKEGVEKAGKIKWWGGLTGSIKSLGKRLPLLAGLFAIAVEIPNIWSATKDKGILGGVTETAKTATRVTTGMIGGAIGAALLSPIPVVGPLLGSVVGYMAGDALASIFTGKSHTEKKMAAEQEANKQPKQSLTESQTHIDTGTTNPFRMQPTMTPQELAMLQMQLYGGNKFGNDFIAKQSGIYY